MKILLINLTRFGDLLQSQAVVTDLVRQGHEVALLCQENFSQAAGLIRGVSRVFPLAGAKLLAKLEGPWQEALAAVIELRHTLEKDFAPDVVSNLSPTISSQVLARFIAADRPAWGFSLDKQGFDRNSSPWGAFLEGASAARNGSPYNIIDIFRQVGRDPGGRVARASRELAVTGQCRERLFHWEDSLLHRPEKAALDSARELLQTESPAGSLGHVAFQLGASEERRQWPPDFFARLGETLWKEAGLTPVLLGTKSEEGLSAQYAETAKHPFINLVGRTGLDQLAAALCNVRLLVTNDTGTMHLAAGLNVPVLAIFLATAQPFDTGPSLAGSCSLEPDLDCHPCAFGAACPRDHQCRRSITPGTVSRLCLARLADDTWAVPEKPGCRAWLTGHDQCGYIRLESLSGHESEDRSLWLAELGRILRQFIDRDPAQAFTCPPAEGPLPLSPAGRESIAAELRELTGFINLLSTQGQVLTLKNLPPMRQKFMETWGRVRRLLANSPHLGSLAGLWLEETQSREDDFSAVLAVIAQYLALFSGMAERL